MPAELTAGPDRPLSPLRERFCAEYLIDFKGRDAAIRAGAKPRSAAVRACEWLKEPAVKAEIERLKAEDAAKIGITREAVLRETAKIAHGDIKQVGGPTKVKALELLGKYLNLWDKPEGEGSGATNVQVNVIFDL